LRQALRGQLPEAIRQRRWKADVTGLANRAIVAQYAAIRALLTRDCWSVRAGLVDGDIVERELTTFGPRIARTDTAIPGWQVGRLLGLELWLRQFFGAAYS
jgi:hypothetical protein